MHSIALTANLASGHQVAGQRCVLGQICSEIHFLPFEFLLEAVLAREAKLTQMPPLDKVNLAVAWAVIDLLRMALGP